MLVPARWGTGHWGHWGTAQNPALVPCSPAAQRNAVQWPVGVRLNLFVELMGLGWRNWHWNWDGIGMGASWDGISSQIIHSLLQLQKLARRS